MNLLVINRIALRTIGRSKMRTGLTTLGIAIGVAAVVSTVAIGEGAANRVHAAIENTGVNMIWAEAGGVNVAGGRTGNLGTRSLVMADAEAIRQERRCCGAATGFSPVPPTTSTCGTPSRWRSSSEESARTMEMLLAAVASVSPLVGGIGVMNIMLVSVVERTKEIGLRLAVGARSRDVQIQFLWESVILSMIGGIVGTGLGFASSVWLADLMEWPVSVSPNAVAVAVAFSAAVGVFFGFYPARKAAQLDPIEALRFET